MDFKIYENGDGAELNIINGNIEIEKGFSNSIYLSLFSNDNWYNIYEKYKTTNDFETALNTLVISKDNLKKIENLALESLNWLTEESIVKSINIKSFSTSFNKIGLHIIIQQNDNRNSKFIITWENQKIILKEQ